MQRIFTLFALCLLFLLPAPSQAQGLTNYTEDYILNEIFRPAEVAPTRPTAVYVALCTNATTPAEAGTGCTEPTWTGYARQSATFGAPADGTGTTREVSNTGALSYGDPDQNASLTHFAIFDASTAGNMLLYGAFAATINTQAGVNDPVSFPIGSLKVRQD